MKKDVIETILKQIIEIDEDTSGKIAEIESKMAAKEKELKRLLGEKEEALDRFRLKEGKRVYDEIMERAEEEKNGILAQGQEKAKAFDALLEKNRDRLREKVFEKLNLK